MNRPGHQNSHGRVLNAPWLAEINRPSETSGLTMPKFRYDRAVSSTTAVDISRVMLTMMMPMALGRMCLVMIRKLLAPATRAESTNSRSRRRSRPRAMASSTGIQTRMNSSTRGDTFSLDGRV
ncbi:Uncharacterised protein [Mycobacteroides abscessus subsp. abscessus]|nr:Uncharacterised protein [Mycobacteroides abscessus subsp. abscessus]